MPERVIFVKAVQDKDLCKVLILQKASKIQEFPETAGISVTKARPKPFLS
jgi:hypothetical protein